MIQSNHIVNIDLNLIINFFPFILTIDEEMDVTWASPAILKRVSQAIGMNLQSLLELRESGGKSQVLRNSLLEDQ